MSQKTMDQFLHPRAEATDADFPVEVVVAESVPPAAAGGASGVSGGGGGDSMTNPKSPMSPGAAGSASGGPGRILTNVLSSSSPSNKRGRDRSESLQTQTSLLNNSYMIESDVPASPQPPSKANKKSVSPTLADRENAALDEFQRREQFQVSDSPQFTWDNSAHQELDEMRNDEFMSPDFTDEMGMQHDGVPPAGAGPGVAGVQQLGAASLTGGSPPWRTEMDQFMGDLTNELHSNMEHLENQIKELRDAQDLLVRSQKNMVDVVTKSVADQMNRQCEALSQSFNRKFSGLNRALEDYGNAQDNNVSQIVTTVLNTVLNSSHLNEIVNNAVAREFDVSVVQTMRANVGGAVSAATSGFEERIGNLENVATLVDTRRVDESARVRAELNELKEVMQDLSRRLADSTYTGGAAENGLTKEMVDQIRFEHENKSDRYFCNSLSVKGFGPEIDGRGSLMTRARRILREDGLGELLNNTIKIQIFPAGEDRQPSLRLTYSDHRYLVLAQSVIGRVTNTAARSGRTISLRINQLTPPRFQLERERFAALAPRWKREKKIVNFSFIVIRGRLMLRASRPGESPSLFAFPETVQADRQARGVEAMDQDGQQVSPPQNTPPPSGSAETPDQCAFCQEPLGNTERDTARLPCGHAFHRHCVFTHMARGGFECPVCRVVPGPFKERNFACFDCKDRYERDTTDEAVGARWSPQDITQRLCITHCGHLHYQDCQDDFLDNVHNWRLASLTGVQMLQLMLNGRPGCRYCQATTDLPAGERARSIVEMTINIDTEYPYSAFSHAPIMERMVFSAGQPLRNQNRRQSGALEGSQRGRDAAGGRAQGEVEERGRSSRNSRSDSQSARGNGAGRGRSPSPASSEDSYLAWEREQDRQARRRANSDSWRRPDTDRGRRTDRNNSGRRDSGRDADRRRRDDSGFRGSRPGSRHGSRPGSSNGQNRVRFNDRN